MKTYKRVLSIAGSDSGGGAGIQADIKTITSLGCFATTALTTLTAQNTVGVQAVEKVNPQFVARQIDSVLEDIGTDSIKIGMLYDEDIIESVARSLHPYPHIPVVFDPVMVATSGDILLKEHAIAALKNTMLSLSTIITPNIREAEILSQMSIGSVPDMEKACRKIHSAGASNVLITGGGFNEGRALDVLFLKESGHFKVFETPKVDTKNTHGTGCTYSAAIASHLSLGHGSVDAIERSKAYIYEAIHSGSQYRLGMAAGPVDHSCWRKSFT